MEQSPKKAPGGHTKASSPVTMPHPSPRRHSCTTCTKPPARKNQSSILCSLCELSYYKICPLLNSQPDHVFRKNKNSGSWHCPQCRPGLPNLYCSKCLQDKNVMLLSCFSCDDKYHADCVNRVDLAVKTFGIPRIWNCSKCQPSFPTLSPDPARAFETFLETRTYNGLKIAHVNLNSLKPRFNKVKVLLEINQLSVFGITETKLVRTEDPKDFEIDGYQLIRRDRPKKYETRKEQHYGGVALYVDNNYVVKEVIAGADGYYEKDLIEYLIVEVTSVGLSFSVILVYSPKSNNVRLPAKLKSLLVDAKRSKPRNPVVIMGDINIDLISDLTAVSKSLKKVFDNAGISCLIKEPTRIDKNLAKCIDLLATDDPVDRISVKGVVNLNLADHYVGCLLSLAPCTFSGSGRC